MSQDSISRFLIDRSNVRGEVVRLTDSWQEILRRADYPHSVRVLLGEAVAATALLAETIKFDGSLTLQVRGAGQVELLVVQVTSDNTFRGMAKCADEVSGETLQELLGDGQMAITIEMGEGKQDYQGIVPLQGDRLQDAIQGYFENSEQLPTRVWLTADESSVSGLFLQKLPGVTEVEGEADQDQWSRVTQLAATVKPEELQALDAGRLLYRLFNEEEVRLFEAQELNFQCTCSRERTAAAIKAMQKEEALEIVAEEGDIKVQCQFCKADYVFDKTAVESLFDASITH